MNKKETFLFAENLVDDKYRSSHPEVFLREGFLKICSKFTGEHPCRSVISIKLFYNFIEITATLLKSHFGMGCNFIEIIVWHGCSSVNLVHPFRTPFYKNTSGGLLLRIMVSWYKSSLKQLRTDGTHTFSDRHSFLQ